MTTTKTEARRQSVLDAAQSLLVEAGGAALTMRKVSDSAGISLGNLQYHFPKREDLLTALLQRFLSRYEQELESLDLGPSGNLQNDLEAIFLRILQSPDFEVACTFFMEIWAASNQSRELQQELAAYYHRYTEVYRRILVAITDGKAAASSINQAISVVLPMIEGHCATRAAQVITDEDLAKEWARMFAASLRSSL